MIVNSSAVALAQKIDSRFILGTATAAYQIEGGVKSDGRGVSIWDTFAQTEGAIANGATADLACNHFELWEQDLDLMQSIGLTAYRLSFSWVRLQPNGDGELKPEGVEFYRKLIEGCRARGIEAYVTLYHWDLPQALQDKGGWANRETAYAFANYTEQVVALFSDLVTNWITINEPWCIAYLGHSWGIHAPGTRDETVALRVHHHVLLAHGLAVEKIRNRAPGALVGISNLISNVNPASQDESDLKAARVLEARLNRIALDPLYLGHYSEDVFAVFEEHGLNRVPDAGQLVWPGDLEIISAKTDFVGINHYTNVLARSDSRNQWSGVEIEHVEPAPSSFGWSNTPEGLTEVIQFVNREYTKLPILVTENGISLMDETDSEGAVSDPLRIAYISGYLEALVAQTPKIPILGYFIWSFMDNFEWAEGYTKRFGLVYVDFETQRRIPKASASWVQALQANRRVAVNV